MNSPRRPLRTAILCGGFVAGTIDIGSASLINWISPLIILRAIASGVLGKPSYHDGLYSTALGLGLQWAMSLLIAAIYVLAAARISRLGKYWALSGAAYGVVVFFVMSYVVVPLSAAWPRNAFTTRTFIENLLAMLLFGLIVAFFQRRFAYGVRNAKQA